MIKVAYFTRYIPHYRAEVLNYLSTQHGIELTVYSSKEQSGSLLILRDSTDIKFEYIHSTTYRIRLLGVNVYFQLDIIKKIIKSDLDVLILSFEKSNLSVWAALILKYFFRKKVLLWGHGRINNVIEKYLKKKMFSYSDGILLYDELAKINYLTKSDKVFVINNALNDRTIMNLKEQISQKDIFNFKCSLGLLDKPVILYVGRLQARRRLKNLINAIKYLTEKGRSVNAIIVGDGPSKLELMQYVLQSELSSQIKFLGSIYDEIMLSKIFLSSTIMAIPGGAGLTVFHSFWYGIPVVVDHRSELHGPEVGLVKNKVTGILVDCDCPNKFGEAISQLLDDHELYLKISENSFSLVSQRYSSENMASAISDSIYFAVRRAR